MSNSEEIYGAVLGCFCCGLIGAGFMLGGLVWYNSVPRRECLCNSEHRCTLDRKCPQYTARLSVSVDHKSTIDVCVPTRHRDETIAAMCAGSIF